MAKYKSTMICILLLTCTLLFSSATYAWTIIADFEDGSLGQKAQGVDAFSEAFRGSVYTNKFVQSGKQALELKIDKGTNGWGQWGGIFRYPSALNEGDEIWFRVSLYFPAGFNFSATGQGIKTQRIHTASPSGGNEGYIGTLIARSNGINVGSEVDPDFYTINSSWESRNLLGPTVPTGKWVTIEQYVKFSSTSGTYRVWRDGNLIFEDVKSKTLRTSKSISDYIYMFTYWNGDAPATQYAYLDNAIITNKKPSEMDKNGNSFIGVNSINFIEPKFTAPPAPPMVN